MDSRRDFTDKILARIGSPLAPVMPGDAKNAELRMLRSGETSRKRACVLVAAEHAAPFAVRVVREAVSVSRFGYRADVVADEVLSTKLRKYVPARNIHAVDSAFEADGFGSARALVVVSSPDIMAKVAMGFGGDFSAKAALWALWHGIDVFMDMSCIEEFYSGARGPNEELHTLYGGYRENLLALGVRHASRGELLPALLSLLGQHTDPAAIPEPDVMDKTAVMPAPAAPPPEIVSDVPESVKRVFITAKDVRAYTGGAEWVLPGNAVVTAEAMDTAARRKIVFRKTDDTSRGENG